MILIHERFLRKPDTSIGDYRIAMKKKKKLLNKYLQITNPIKYAKKAGVVIGEKCKFYSANFGSEPWLITIGNHVEITGGVQFITHDGVS